MTAPRGDLRRLALERVRQLQDALPSLGVDFQQAEEAIRQVGAGWIGEPWNDALFAGTPPLEVICLFPDHHQMDEARDALRYHLPEVWEPELVDIPPEAFQLFHLLILLLTRRLHLGDVLLFLFEPEMDPPESRQELMAPGGWLPRIRGQHAMVRQTLRWLLTLRSAGATTRRIAPCRIPVHLGWVETDASDLLEELLVARRPLFLHQLFEILLFLQISIPQFVRYLFFVEATTVGTSQRQLIALESPGREVAR